MNNSKIPLMQQALRFIGVEVDEQIAYQLYHLADMVRRHKEGGTLKDMCKIKEDSKKEYPYIIKWSSKTHRENHQI